MCKVTLKHTPSVENRYNWLYGPVVWGSATQSDGTLTIVCRYADIFQKREKQ